MPMIADSSPHVVRIKPTQGWSAINLRELFDYRELMYFLVWRDVKVRYKQTALGIMWVILQPVIATGIFTIIFGNLAKMPSGGVPYALFAMAGLVPWNYFAGAFSRGSASLVSSSHLIAKVYFPRLIIPIASVLGGLVDMAIAMVVLLVLMLYFGIFPTTKFLLVPLFVVLAVATATGVSLWLSALNVRYRDVNYLVPFAVQVWLYATPVVYPSTLIPQQWRAVYGLNPMAGVVEGFRWALLGATEGPGLMAAVSAAVVACMLVSGALVFRRMERTFADVI